MKIQIVKKREEIVKDIIIKKENVKKWKKEWMAILIEYKKGKGYSRKFLNKDWDKEGIFYLNGRDLKNGMILEEGIKGKEDRKFYVIEGEGIKWEIKEIEKEDVRRMLKDKVDEEIEKRGRVNWITIKKEEIVETFKRIVDEDIKETEELKKYSTDNPQKFRLGMEERKQIWASWLDEIVTEMSKMYLDKEKVKEVFNNILKEY